MILATGARNRLMPVDVPKRRTASGPAAIEPLLDQLGGPRGRNRCPCLKDTVAPGTVEKAISAPGFSATGTNPLAFHPPTGSISLHGWHLKPAADPL